MKAVVFDKHGGPEVLECREVDTPRAGADEVLIKVAACGLNHLDLWVREGLGVEIPMPHIGGCEVVGTVAECGSGVSGFTAGEQVMVSPGLSCGQ